MTQDRYGRTTIDRYNAHLDEWDLYLAQPFSERVANQEKIDATFRTHGVQAARDMMRALGYPIPPAGMWDPVEMLEFRHAQKADDHADDDLRKPAGRLDH